MSFLVLIDIVVLLSTKCSYQWCLRMAVSSGSPLQHSAHLFNLCQCDKCEKFLIVAVICVSTEKTEGIGENSDFISTITLNTSNPTFVPSNSFLPVALKDVHFPQTKTGPFIYVLDLIPLLSLHNGLH